MRFTLWEAARHLFFSSLKMTYNTGFIEHAGGSRPLKYLARHTARGEGGGCMKVMQTFRTTVGGMRFIFFCQVKDESVSAKDRQVGFQQIWLEFFLSFPFYDHLKNILRSLTPRLILTRLPQEFIFAFWILTI